MPIKSSKNHGLGPSNTRYDNLVWPTSLCSPQQLVLYKPQLIFMEVAAKIPLLEPVLIILRPGMRFNTWLIGGADSEPCQDLDKADLLSVKTMLFPHEFRNVSDGKSFHNEETGQFPSVRLPLVPPRMTRGRFWSRHYFNVTRILKKTIDGIALER